VRAFIDSKLRGDTCYVDVNSFLYFSSASEYRIRKSFSSFFFKDAIKEYMLYDCGHGRYFNPSDLAGQNLFLSVTGSWDETIFHSAVDSLKENP